MKGKKWLVLLAAVVLISLLAACGDGGDDEVTITVVSRFGQDIPADIFFREQVAAFNELDNGITVEMNNIVPEAEYLDMLRTSFAIGEPPNVFIEYGGTRVLEYVQADALVNVQPYLDRYPEWYGIFFPAMFDALRYDGIDGTWGVPFQAYIVVLYYNTEMFAEQGLTPPTTWAELMTVSQAFMDAGISPFQVGARDAWRLGHLHSAIVLGSLGADSVERLANRTLAYDSPEMIETFRVISDMLDRGFLGVDVLDNDYNTERAAFTAGQVPMRWDGSWFVMEIFGTDVYDRTGIMPFPTVNPAFSTVNKGGSSDMWFVSSLGASDEQIAASIEFLRFITSEEFFAGTNEVAAALYPAAFTPTAATPPNPLMERISEIANNAGALFTDLQTYDPEAHMLDTVRNALQGLAMGNSPEDTAAEIERRIEIR